MLNKVHLIGRLGIDPDYRCTPSGTPVATFSLATSERRKTQDGTVKDITEWHNIVTWDVLADTCRSYLHKGRLVFIEGKLRTRKYQDQAGQDRFITEIVADQVKFLDKSQTNDGTTDSNPVPPDDYPF